jgi:hypothetical protein
MAPRRHRVRLAAAGQEGIGQRLVSHVAAETYHDAPRELHEFLKTVSRRSRVPPLYDE